MEDKEFPGQIFYFPFFIFRPVRYKIAFVNAEPKGRIFNQPNSKQVLSRVGITMGDAAGIGAEIILKALADEKIKKICTPIVIGDLSFLRKTARDLGLEFDFVEAGENVAPNFNQTLVYNLNNLPVEITAGEESAITGKACADYIETAVELWRNKKIDAMATAPISKKALALGGYDFPGHTEFLAHLTDTKEFAMSFFAGDLRVVLLSTHVSLRGAIDLVKKEKLIELIRFSHKEISRLLKKDARIAVAGLNPHASEGGMFGTEEAIEIIPAINECREKFGIDVSGAFSPDTVFLRGFRGEFDAVISCYHDQATIAVKCLSFGASVNVTLGLPLIRTSVDHGTALDIAGRNKADASSMKTAIRTAADLINN
ncbi:MAG TPA: 4-hydroxythreonine-4-phosphate dehydrogenase PdxA [Pyrinomonadaceae bacterium]|nr:4-hydroxythreonine-4-phosphate dehydrogenase PdxA [Pyrinomonadaceae bacterium]